MGRRGVFRVNRAIQKLERSAKWLAEAHALAKEGTLEALLAYCRVGYTSGNWHLPSIVTKYEHGIKNRLARLLEKELPQGYHFPKGARRPQEFALHFRGRRVAELNEYKRTITLIRSFEWLEAELTSEIRWAEEKMKEMRGRLKRLEEDADKIRRSPFYRWFGLVRLGRFSWIRRGTFENRISRILEDARKQAANAEAEWSRALDRFPKRVIWFNAFRDTWPDALRRLEALGFRLNTRVMFETEKQAEKDMEEQTALT